MTLSKIAVLWRILASLYKVEFTSLKPLITLHVNLISPLLILLKHMSHHGSHTSRLLINRSQKKYLLVCSRKQFRSWSYALWITHDKISVDIIKYPKNYLTFENIPRNPLERFLESSWTFQEIFDDIPHNL